MTDRRFLACVLLAAQADAANMNGKYSVTSVDKQNVPFNDDCEPSRPPSLCMAPLGHDAHALQLPDCLCARCIVDAAKGHEYFDVWGPEIATTYGQVSPMGQRTLRRGRASLPPTPRS